MDGRQSDLPILLPGSPDGDAKTSPHFGRLVTLRSFGSRGTEFELQMPFWMRNPMLAEKFFLVLETLIRGRVYADGAPRVVSTSPHVPVKLPEPKQG